MKYLKKAIYMVVALFCLTLTAYSQSISLNVKDVTVKEVMELLKEREGYSFVFESSDVDTRKVISMDAQNQSIDAIVKQVLQGQDLYYEITGKNIVVRKNAPRSTERREKRVTGVVTDEFGDPIIGANVVEKGTSNGIITDIDGNYSMMVADNAVLVFSYIGYASQEIAVSNRNTVSISLFENTQLMDEVVVVGYGVQKKSHLTGAVGAVKMGDDITGRPAVEIGQSLYGQIPGVQVIGGSGRPGMSSSIQIRGVNSVSASSAPLVVIDGIATPGYDMNLINNADVESIEILKDASSSAIYGSRGANGVILITTKKGTTEQPKVSLNYVFGIQKLMNKIPVMSSAEYAQAYMDAAQNGWVDSGGDPNAPNTIEARGAYKYTWPEAFERPETLYNTDWQDVLFEVAPMHKIDVNIAGASDKTDYLMSVGYVDQDGIVMTSGYKKYSMSMKMNSKVNNWLNVGGMVNANYSNEKEAFWRSVEWSVQYPRIYPVYAENGYLGCNSYVPGFENYNGVLFRPNNGHPLYNMNNDTRHKTFNNLGNVYALFSIMPGLKFKTALNFYYRRLDDHNYEAMDHDLGEPYYTVAKMTVENAKNLNYTSQNLLTYDKTLGSHEFSALLGFEYNQNDYYKSKQSRRDYDNDLLHSLTAGKTILESQDEITKTTLISYFGRVNYSYQNKYMLSAAFRRDGSSRFAPNNKWGSFPSVSAGWMVTEEDFMKSSLDVINMMKVRVSYGLTGNDNFKDYAWIGQLKQEKVAFGNNISTSYYPEDITNPDLKWERTRQMNAGLDFGFLKGRIQFNIDYYYSISDGLLLNVPIPAITGFDKVFMNIGKLRNQGLELNMTTYNITNKHFSWNTNFNISGNRNKILELGPDNAPMILSPENYGGMQKINMVGNSVFNFYGYKYGGVYMNQAEIDNDPASYSTAKPGDGRYIDVNKDGVLNADDRTAIGDPNPKFIWGFTNNFTYKGFDLSILFQGAHKFDICDDNAHRSLMYHEGRNFLKGVVNRWRSESEPGDGHHYRLTVDLGEYEKTPSSYWIKDASYLRLKSLTFGYTLPKAVAQKLHLSSARVYFNGLNLFTITDADVWDPESFRGTASDTSARGIMGNSYPTAKVFSFGVNVEF